MKTFIQKHTGLESQEDVEYYANLGARFCPHVESAPLSGLDFNDVSWALQCHACQLQDPVYEGEDVTKRWEDKVYLIPEPGDLGYCA